MLSSYVTLFEKINTPTLIKNIMANTTNKKETKLKVFISKYKEIW